MSDSSITVKQSASMPSVSQLRAGDVVRRVRDRGIAAFSNEFILDGSLSLKSKGLLSLVLSLPDDWDFSIAGIVEITKEGRTAIYTAISELKKAGYCQVLTKRNAKGRIESVEYTFFDKKANLLKDSPDLGFPDMDNPDMEKISEKTENALYNNIFSYSNYTQANANSINKDVEYIQDNIQSVVKEKKIKENSKKEKNEKKIFADFVKLYKRLTGRACRGVDTEFKDFVSRHRDWRAVLPILSLAIERETRAREQARAEKRFFPEPKMLQTYLGKQRAWELYANPETDGAASAQGGESAACMEYIPTGRGFRFDEKLGCYLHTGQFMMGDILDGYEKHNRPDGARLMLNNGRGLIIWNKSQQQWINQKKR